MTQHAETTTQTKPSERINAASEDVLKALSALERTEFDRAVRDKFPQVNTDAPFAEYQASDVGRLANSVLGAASLLTGILAELDREAERRADFEARVAAQFRAMGIEL